jgi:hypothetical protein
VETGVAGIVGTALLLVAVALAEEAVPATAEQQQTRWRRRRLTALPSPRRERASILLQFRNLLVISCRRPRYGLNRLVAAHRGRGTRMLIVGQMLLALPYFNTS